MGEIVQLFTADVRCADGGVWYFDITKSEGDGKKLKTVSSIRRVPLHCVLIELGLLDYRKSVKGKRLFPDIEPGADGYFSHNFSKWWGRYSRQISVSTKKTAFHSFRHNFKDALQAANVPEFAARALMGHTDKSVHSQYGSGPSLLLLKEGIDTLAFPLNWENMKGQTA